MNDQIFLSSTDTSPMYSQIMEQVLAKVLAGDWRAGQALPSIRELASSSRVSVITVKRAYLELERNGVIVTRQGKGSFVADTQDLPRQIAQDEFDAHLIGMLGAAGKLGMPAIAVVDVVRNALDSGLSVASSDKNAVSVR
jgi:GntR family transcriptional regulator